MLDYQIIYDLFYPQQTRRRYILEQHSRRVAEFVLDLTFPAHFTDAQKKLYLSAVNACPVHQTLHPDVKVTVNVK